jgi:hypothetical protein
VDASLVEAPKQRNSRAENAEIKTGKCPRSWEENPAKKRQKDCEARWTIKSGKTYYGYKTHINIDVKHKLIRAYQVTAANSGDKAQLNTLLAAVPHNAQEVWADGAYFSEKQEQHLKRIIIEAILLIELKNSPHILSLSEKIVDVQKNEWNMSWFYAKFHERKIHSVHRFSSCHIKNRAHEFSL